ncbi:10197_t:CDS:2, partial [Dentiscutata heterogama]
RQQQRRSSFAQLVDAEDKQLYYRCSACSYKHFAEKDECLCKTIQRPSRLIKAMISNKDVFKSIENMNEDGNLEQETDLVSQDQEESTTGWD